MVKIMEHPIKIHDLGGFPIIFGKHPYVKKKQNPPHIFRGILHPGALPQGGCPGVAIRAGPQLVGDLGRLVRIRTNHRDLFLIS